MNDEISFKLLTASEASISSFEWNEKNQKKWELKVLECKYENEEIKKIFVILKDKKIQELLENGQNKSFVIKNFSRLQAQKISGGNLEILKESLDFDDITENEFRFLVKSVSLYEEETKIECRSSSVYNGQNNIQVLCLKGKFNDNRKDYLQPGQKLIIRGIKNFKLNEDKKELNILVGDFEKIEPTNDLFGKTNLEVSVQSSERLKDNDYLLACKEIKTSKDEKLGDYQEIIIKLGEKELNELDKSKMIKITIIDAFLIIQRSQNNILEINQDFSDFESLKSDDRESEEVKESKDDFWKEYNEKKIDNWIGRLKKHQLIIRQIAERFDKEKGKKIINDYYQLTQKINKVIDQKSVQEEVNQKEKEIFFSKNDYQEKKKLSAFFSYLKKFKANLSQLERELINYEDYCRDYSQKNWKLLMTNDKKINDLLNQQGINSYEFINNLEWNELYSWIEEDGTINYEKLTNWLTEKKSNCNKLGYLSEEIQEGGIFQEWNEKGINKSEAQKARNLDYSLDQWKNEKYDEYKNNQQNRVLADGIITVLERWKLTLTKQEIKQIKNSLDSPELIKNFLEIQNKKFLFQFKECVREIITNELAKTPPIILEELGDYQDYERILGLGKSLLSIENFLDRLMEKIKEIKEENTPLLIAKSNTKKNITACLKKFNFNVKKLHSYYQNWQKEVDKQKTVDEVWEFEQKLTNLIIEINNAFKQSWLFPLSKLNKKEINQSKDQKNLRKKIQEIKNKQLINLILHQANQYLQIYNELLDEKNQNYSLQKQKLVVVEKLIEKVQELRKSSLRPGERKIYEEAGKAKENLEELIFIRNLAEKFNSLVDIEEKKKILKEIDEDLSMRVNSSKQEKDQAKKNLILLESGKETNHLLINERQKEISLLDIDAIDEDLTEEKEEFNDNEDWGPWQKNILITLIILVLVWIIYRWYKKKKEDPFV